MIFSIGYSNRTLPEFLKELDRRKITQLWDVRSSPWSRNAAFNAPQIESWANANGIFYRRCGDVLGGMSKVKLDDPRYTASLQALLDASCQEPLVTMCAEGDPAHCHRSWAIGAKLLTDYGVITRNILRNGRGEDITETLLRVPTSKLSPEVRASLDAQLDFS